MRNLRRLCGVIALTLALSVVNATGAVADDGIITDQPFADFYGLKNAHAKGMDGAGVTIAMLDGWVDTSVPELAGASIESVEKCPIQKGLDDTSHATAVASILLSKDYGWAPKATLLSYPIADTETKSDTCRWEIWDAIHDALSKDVDIITIQISSDEGAGFSDRLAVLRAARMNVPVVWSSGNTGTETETSGMETNGAIAVGSHTLDGTPSEWATYGRGLTLTALGEEITLRVPDDSGALTRITSHQRGTSVSAPMVAGALALGMQKWPKATGNQLTRALLETTIPCEAKYHWSDKCGYGAMNVGVFAQHPDPTTLEDTNPLLDKQRFNVDHDRKILRDYDDGVWRYEDLFYDTSYTYRGSDIPQKGERVKRVGQFGSSPRYMKRVHQAEQADGLIST